MVDLVFKDSDKECCKIVRAYLLGRISNNGKPRKIRVEFRDIESKDLFMAYSNGLTRVGNDGKIFYINDDLPESVKRRKTDIYRYIKYMQLERGHMVERSGDDLLINGQRWRICDLNKLPVGDRLLDSRTLYKNGMLAFQSSISPSAICFQLRFCTRAKHLARSNTVTRMPRPYFMAIQKRPK